MKSCLLLFSVLWMNICISAQNPKLPPSSNFDLTAWKLQTLDANSNFIEIQAPDLTNHYTSNFFYTDSTDGSMVFRVPSNGQSTSGSSYPRVELRQMTNGANWILNDPTEHYMTAQCKVVAVADAKPQTIIGQIHGSNTVSEMLKLRWTGYKAGQCYIEARFKTNDATMSEYGVVLANGLSLGDLINYTITMKNGTINCTVNGTTGTQTYTPDVWTLTDAYYFKAGDYLQYNNQIVPDPTIIYGQNQFYKLSLIKQTTAVQSVQDENKINIFPNPANNVIHLDYELSTPSNVNLNIYDSNGRMVKSLLSNEIQNTGIYHRSFDVSDLSGGVYSVKFNNTLSSKTIKLLIIR